jgi:hypothetical protein
MKAFLAALVFVVLIAAATGFVSEYGISHTATEAHSLESARVGEGSVENRVGWEADRPGRSGGD